MQRAAAAELARRERGEPRQEKATRPFGAAPTEIVREFAHKPEGGYDHEPQPRRRAKRR